MITSNYIVLLLQSRERGIGSNQKYFLNSGGGAFGSPFSSTLSTTNLFGTTSSFTSDGETKAGTDGDSGDVACTSATSATSATSSTFYKEQFICHTCNQTIFDTSVQAMMEGIAKNAYNHHKGDPSTRPPCLCWRPEGWKLNQCADCKQPLSEERFQKEQELKEIAMKEDAAATAATPPVVLATTLKEFTP